MYLKQLMGNLQKYNIKGKLVTHRHQLAYVVPETRGILQLIYRYQRIVRLNKVTTSHIPPCFVSTAQTSMPYICHRINVQGPYSFKKHRFTI